MKYGWHYGFVLGVMALGFAVLMLISHASLLLLKQVPVSTAQTLYVVGYKAYKDIGNKDLTRNLWKMAVTVYPLMGHLWVELASLEKNAFGDETASRIILQHCIDSDTQHKDYPASQCLEVLNDYEMLDSPGTLLPLIQKGL